MAFKFVIDCNSGKLVTWLRMMGYDAVMFTGDDDRQMVSLAFHENRVILTRDTQVMKFGLVTGGKVKAVYITSENPEAQVRQVVQSLHLDTRSGLFTRCMECNRLLETRTKEQVAGCVPPQVFATRTEYLECPGCGRIYWKGSHWEHMVKRMERVEGNI
jgi:uncharacterized protein with PIN domain